MALEIKNSSLPSSLQKVGSGIFIAFLLFLCSLIIIDGSIYLLFESLGRIPYQHEFSFVLFLLVLSCLIATKTNSSEISTEIFTAVLWIGSMVFIFALLNFYLAVTGWSFWQAALTSELFVAVFVLFSAFFFSDYCPIGVSETGIDLYIK